MTGAALQGHDGPGGVVLAPVSPAMAQLLHQLQAEQLEALDFAAQAAAAAAGKHLPPAGAAIVLPMPERFTQQDYREQHGYRMVSVRKGFDFELRLQTGFLGDPAYSDWCRPGVWYGTEERVDTTGRRWQSSSPLHYVMDDFGALVPVAR